MKLRDKQRRWPTRTVVLVILVAALTGLVPPVTGQAHGPDPGNVTVSNGQESRVVTDIAYPALAFDSTGGGWAVWEQTGTFDGQPDSEIMISRGVGVEWSSPARLSPDPAAWNHAPALAVDSRDRVWVAWSRSTGTDDVVRIARRRGRAVDEAGTGLAPRSRQPVPRSGGRPARNCLAGLERYRTGQL